MRGSRPCTPTNRRRRSHGQERLVLAEHRGLLHDLPNAVLWLKETNAQLHDNVHREAAARGIAAGPMMLSAGVAELVDALDLGSSDESCGGSSPSARTKRWQAFARRFPEDLIPIRDFGSPNHWRRPHGWRRTF